MFSPNQLNLLFNLVHQCRKINFWSLFAAILIETNDCCLQITFPFEFAAVITRQISQLVDASFDLRFPSLLSSALQIIILAPSSFFKESAICNVNNSHYNLEADNRKFIKFKKKSRRRELNNNAPLDSDACVDCCCSLRFALPCR